MYLWGNIAPYIISYFYHFGGKDGLGEKNLSNTSDVVTVLPIITLMLAFMNPTGAFLFKVVNPKHLIGFGSAIGVLAMCLASVATTYA